MTYQDITSLFQTNWIWAAGCAAFFVAVTKIAYNRLPIAQKDTLTLWLMGAEGTASWAESFCDLFDAVFGKKHLSWRCLLRSIIASLSAVLIVWGIMGVLGFWQDRSTELQIGTILLVGLGVNLITDYISLLETRWLLNLLRQRHSIVIHLIVLLLDIALSAALIIGALALYFNSPFFEGTAPEIGEMLGIFSPYAVFFYSTFITSIWLWGYIASAAVLAIFRATPLSNWVDEKNADKWLVTVGGSAVFSLCFIATIPLQKDEVTGISPMENFLCSIDKGATCNHVSMRATDDATKLAFFMKACEGGVTQQCLDRGLKELNVNSKQAADLFSKACEGGNATGCSNLGYMYDQGLGVDQNISRAVELFQHSCGRDDALGCSNLGYMYEAGRGLAKDNLRAVELYERGCVNGNALGCVNLGIAYEKGLGVAQDTARAVTLFQQGCGGGDAGGCTNLGLAYEKGLGVVQDHVRAVTLFKQGCDGGSTGGCTNLGLAYGKGLGVAQDHVRAVALFQQGCDGGSKRGCTNLGFMYSKGLGVVADAPRAAKLYQQGCDGGIALGCNNLGSLYQGGHGVAKDLQTAQEWYQKACDIKGDNACDRAKALDP